MFINHINIYNYLYRVLIYKKLIMSIILNNSNITVDYRTSNFNIETVKSDIYVKDINLENNIANEPRIIPDLNKIEMFTYSGSGNFTEYTKTFTQNTLCDILIVGGGGGGDRQIGGGGGGGAVLYATNVVIPTGIYTIKVGKGGENGNGGNSEAFGATCLGGGSTPFVAWGTPNNGTAGGSGSGASPGGGSLATGGTVGTSIKGSLLSSGTLYNGNIGGNALQQNQSPTAAVCGGGGGGAGTAGLSSSLTQYTTRSSWIAGGTPSKGGDGVAIDILGTTYYWGAGGGGGSVITHAGDGGLGGGGGGGHGMSSSLVYPAGLAGAGGINSGSNGSNTGTENGGNGGAGTGSGGGGGGYNANSATYNAGSGGSGIVIIKYRDYPVLEGNPVSNKLIKFSYIPPPLVYDFTPYNTVATWTAYATSIGATTNVNAYQDDGVFISGPTSGSFTLPLNNSNYNYLIVYFGNVQTSGDQIITLKINGVTKETCSINVFKTYSQSYAPGDILSIHEDYGIFTANLKITLMNTNYIYNFNPTKSVEYQAQLKTGVGGWRIVRYLPPNIGRWYSGNNFTSTSVNSTNIGTPYDYTNEWGIPFETFDEMFFATFDTTYWLRCLRTSVQGTYDNALRPIISSSSSSIPYSARWYQRDGSVHEPWVSINDHNSAPQLIVYAENGHAAGEYLRDGFGGMCVLVRNSAVNSNITKNIEYQIQLKTGVGGWRIVRYLPATSTTWYPINDNLAGITSSGISYDYTNFWTIPFGTFDEFVFATFNTNYWLQVSRIQAIGENYTNAPRTIIKSSISNTSYTANWYNRAATSYDPQFGLRNHRTAPYGNVEGGGDLLLYVAGSTALGTDSASFIKDGGLCVFVRNSAVNSLVTAQNYSLIVDPNKYNIMLPKSSFLSINNGDMVQFAKGLYNLSLGSSQSSIIPLEGQIIPITTTYQTSNIDLRIKYNATYDIPTYITNEPIVTPTNFITDNYYPRTPSTNSYTWTDYGKQVVVKVSDVELGTSYVYKLFDHNPGETNNKFHSSQVFTNGGNTTYSGSTRFKGIAGMTISIDLGRPIYPKKILIKNIESTSTASPGLFRFFASNNSSCWNDNNHSSWVEIHNQTTNLTSINSRYNIIDLASNFNKFRYYTMVVTTLTGNYSYLIFSELKIGGDEKIEAVDDYKLFSLNHKILNFNYNNNLTFSYRTDESPYTWQEAFNEAVANGRRIPTITELRNYMASNPSIFTQWDGFDYWVPVVNYSVANNKDWVQVGTNPHYRGKSHVQDQGSYPSWGDLSTNTSDYAKIYFEILEGDALVAYYNFNNSNNLGIDNNPSTTKYNLTPTIVGNTGGYDTSLAIDGASFQATNDGDFLDGNFPLKTIYDNSVFGISVSCWFYKKSGTTYDNSYNTRIYEFYNPSDSAKYLSVSAGHNNNIHNLNFSFAYTSGETYCSNILPNLPLDVWHHIVITLSKTGNITFHVNGNNLNLVAGSTDGTIRIYNSSAYPIPTFPNVSKLRIFLPSPGQSKFNGNIDEFYVFNKVLSQAEITELYNKAYYIPQKYMIDFPVNTIVDINYQTTILKGKYDVIIGSSTSTIIPKEGQNISISTTYQTSNIDIRYNLQAPTTINSTSNLTAEPIISYYDNYVIETFTYYGTGNTGDYTISFAQDTLCDILIVGGGGAGGGRQGGGGGAGGVLFLSNQILYAGSSHIIKVGKGGGISGNAPDGSTNCIANNGIDSEFATNIAYGGSGGAGFSSTKPDFNITTNRFASGGGATGWFIQGDQYEGWHSPNERIIQTSVTLEGGSSYKGGRGWQDAVGGDSSVLLTGFLGGGGGGAGESGKDAIPNNNTSYTGKAGDGGIGLNYSSIFGSNVGHNGWFGGGGAGTGASISSDIAGIGGIGGGGNGNTGGVGVAGINGTGGGGGAGGYANQIGGIGGSGIVIIRYLDKGVRNYYSHEYIYPPYRYFTYNSSTLVYTVQNGVMDKPDTMTFTYNYTYDDSANTIGNNNNTTSLVKNTHGMGEYTFSVGGTQRDGGRSSGVFIYALQSDYETAYSGTRPGVNSNSGSIGQGWYAAGGWSNNGLTYNSSFYYNSLMPGAWVKIQMPREIIFTSFEILGGKQHNRAPKNFKIYGSNTNTTNFSDWILLHTQTNYTYVSFGSTIDATTAHKKGPKVKIVNTLPFKNYLLVISEKYNDSTDIMTFQGWYIYGREKIDYSPAIYTFNHSGGPEPNTSHNITFSHPTLCDILVVGGGGGGGKRHGGGGGAGTLLYHKNVILDGNYNIMVGKGGDGHPSAGTTQTLTAFDGNYSQLIKNDGTQNYYASGGGRGTSSGWTHANTNGGQGFMTGGISRAGYTYSSELTLSQNNIFNGVPVQVLNKEYVNILISPEGCRGNMGGTQVQDYKGGGGGGAKTRGDNHDVADTNPTTADGYGGLGLDIDITGTLVTYAGGGGGSDFNGTVSQVFNPAYPTIQSRGGGGFGSDNGMPQNGLNGTGGGGGGQGNDTAGNPGGNGGSGIVIIKAYNHKRFGFNTNLNYLALPIDSVHLIAWYRLDGNGIDSSGVTGNLMDRNRGLTYDYKYDISANLPYASWANSSSTLGDYWALTPDINRNVPLTFAFWFRVEDTGVYTMMGYGNNSGNDPGIQFDINNGTLNISTALDTHWTFSASYTGIKVNTWYHLCYVLTDENPVKTYLYVNGILVATNTGTLNKLLKRVNNLTVANSGDNGRGYRGDLGDIRIYNKALSIIEINTLYNGYKPNTYNINFPANTIVEINNSGYYSTFKGSYDININASSYSIVPKEGQQLSKPNTFNSINLDLRYHLLNPLRDSIGAQWTYSQNNTSVYHLGNVGIGTKNPEYALHVNGNIFTSKGAFTTSTQTSWTTLSDRRIKNNITKASYETCLENVKNIELYRFNFKNDVVNTTDRNQLGFIAQEVQKVYPKAVEANQIYVSGDNRIDDLLSLDTTQIDYTLYGAIKYLIDKVEYYEKKLSIYESSNIVITEDVLETSSNFVITEDVLETTSNIVITEDALEITSNIVITEDALEITSNFVITEDALETTSNFAINQEITGNVTFIE